MRTIDLVSIRNGSRTMTAGYDREADALSKRFMDAPVLGAVRTGILLDSDAEGRLVAMEKAAASAQGAVGKDPSRFVAA